MRSSSSPIKHPALRAFAALLRRWLGFVLGIYARRAAAPDARRLCEAEYRLKQLILARAVEQLPARAPRGKRTIPRGPPPGFRHTCAGGSDFRLLTRNVLPKAHGKRARLARLDHVHAHLDEYVDRLIRRLMRGLVRARLAAVAPAAEACVRGATFAHGADTS